MGECTSERQPSAPSWTGDGDPLVLIAGLGGQGTQWQPFLSTAAHRFRVLTFDNPGAGCSPALTGPLSIREMAHCVLRLLDQLGVERASVIGRSMGGMIAQELALLAPERIQRLVLVSTAARVDGHLPEVFRLWARMAGTGLRRARCARSAPGAAHLPYLECPGTFARIVLGTLNSEAKP